MIVWYTKRALVFGWVGTGATKRVFLHLFIRMEELHPIYLQIFTHPDNYIFTGYETIATALTECKAALS
jgi:hypothetical protein